VNTYKQENRWKRRMLPNWILSIKGRTCNPTPFVHQYMTKKTTFYEKRRDNSSKMLEYGPFLLYFLSLTLMFVPNLI